MSSEDYRRKAQDFLSLARQLARPEDRATILTIATFWLERAQEAEKAEQQQQKQKQPEKEPERETC